MKPLIKTLLTIIPVLGIGSTLVAAEASSDRQAGEAAEFRQALLQLVRSNVGPLGAMAKGHIPFDTEVMKKNGMRIEQLSKMMPDYFMLDTRKFDIKTDAKPEIWDNMDDFSSKIGDLQSAAANLQQASMSTDEAEYKKAVGMLLKSCKSCHDEYKKD